MKHYSLSGEWVEATATAWRIGLSAETVQDLGDVTFVEFPPVGAALSPESPAGVIEAVKAATDYHSPVAGVVSRVNETLLAAPLLLNRSPEEDGWLLELTGVTPEAVASLLDATAWKLKVGRP